MKQHLVLVELPFLSTVDYAQFLEGYDHIHRVTWCETALTRRWRREFRPAAIKGRLSKVKSTLMNAREFTFEEDSLCFVSEMTESALAVRLLIGKFRRETRHGVLCRVGTCLHRTDACKTNDWLAWLENNAYVLLGAPPLSVKFYQWMLGERRFYNEKKVIDYHLVYSNRWSSNQHYLEIKYPVFDDVKASHSGSQYVLFFDRGTGLTSIFPEISRERWIATTSQVLKALTDLYKDEDVKLLLKPHPRQTEIPYELSGFDVYDGRDTAETMFYRDRQAIRAVYSVASTALRTASLFGIDAYAFGELYGFPREMLMRFKRFVLDFSSVVSIRSLDELPLPPRDRSPATTEEDLERLAALFREIISQRDASPQKFEAEVRS